MTRLTAIIIALCVIAFLVLCVAFGSTVTAKGLILVVIGGAVAMTAGELVGIALFKKKA